MPTYETDPEKVIRAQPIASVAVSALAGALATEAAHYVNKKRKEKKIKLRGKVPW
jgi:hypothetical protein